MVSCPKCGHSLMNDMDHVTVEEGDDIDSLYVVIEECPYCKAYSRTEYLQDISGNAVPTSEEATN